MEVPRKNKLGHCEVCDCNLAKYTCPRCEVKTCSLGCNLIHKKELSCLGLPDKIPRYKPMKELTQADFFKDYRYLNETMEITEKYRKYCNKKWSRNQMPLPYQLHKLRASAYERGVRLFFTPHKFSRHVENTTFYNWKTGKLSWRIEWVFMTTENMIVTSERILDEELLGRVFTNCLKGQCDNEDLEVFRSAGLPGLVLALRAEKKSNSFHEMDPNVSLRENLNGKIIIEFPTIFVMFKHSRENFQFIEDEEDVEITENSEKCDTALAT